jgi:hypothetical protein
MVYETPGSAQGDWDLFQVRSIGLAVQDLMARRFGGEAQRLKRDSARRIARVLKISPVALSDLEQESLEDFAPVLSLISDLSRWTGDEKRLTARVILGKKAVDERDYVKLLQKHARLREAIRGLGSKR